MTTVLLPPDLPDLLGDPGGWSADRGGLLVVLVPGTTCSQNRRRVVRAGQVGPTRVVGLPGLESQVR